jgi:hypothetical protein
MARATSATKTTSIATMFSISCRPSTAPRVIAVSALASSRGRSMRVSSASVPGTITETSAAADRPTVPPMPSVRCNSHAKPRSNGKGLRASRRD